MSGHNWNDVLHMNKLHTLWYVRVIMLFEPCLNLICNCQHFLPVSFIFYYFQYETIFEGRVNCPLHIPILLPVPSKTYVSSKYLINFNTSSYFDSWYFHCFQSWNSVTIVYILLWAFYYGIVEIVYPLSLFVRDLRVVSFISSTWTNLHITCWVFRIMKVSPSSITFPMCI